jgi:hypothetical protein
MPKTAGLLRSTQTVPFVEVKTVPAPPVATKFPPPKVTDQRFSEVPEIRVDQVMPSEELRIAPFHPTATYRLFPWTMSRRTGEPEFTFFHTEPSEDTAIAPDHPTAQKLPFKYLT